MRCSSIFVDGVDTRIDEDGSILDLIDGDNGDLTEIPMLPSFAFKFSNVDWTAQLGPLLSREYDPNYSDRRVLATFGGKEYPTYVSTKRFCDRVIDRIVQQKRSNPSKYIAVINAPVKSGKRIMVEQLSISMDKLYGKRVKHIYITSLNRKDIADQKDELELFGVDVIMASAISAVPFNPDQYFSNGYEWIAIHFDEADYGTSVDQSLDKKFFPYFAEIKDKLIMFAYSATNEEMNIAASNDGPLANSVICNMFFDPGPTYCGAGYFLRQPPDGSGTSSVLRAPETPASALPGRGGRRRLNLN
jgi:hypothetical protein